MKNLLSRVKYMDPEARDEALWCRVYYVDDGLTREEIYTTSAESDEYRAWRRRVSRDNGRTWSAFESIPDFHRVLPGGSIALYPQGVQFDAKRRILFRGLLTFTWRGLPLFTFDWKTGEHPLSSHAFVVENGVERLLRFEEGPDYDPAQPFDEEYYATNRAYPGQSLAAAPDGTVFFPLVCAERGKRLFTGGGLRLMRRDPVSGQWLSSNPVSVSLDWSSCGLLEPDVAILKDGSLLIVCRGHSTAGMPGFKWMSRSFDGGRTLTPVTPLRYDDGTDLYSPDSIHYFFRSRRTGKLYWLANILSEPPKEPEPRYPLQIAEIDEEKAAVKKAGIVVVDDRRPGEPERLQLSNFALIENRETLDLEIYVTRLGENPAIFWSAPVYRYVFSP